MVGSRAVIADRLGAIVAEKNGAGIADLREQGLRVSDGKLKVLRRQMYGRGSLDVLRQRLLAA